jgi:hypothetical protein
MMERGRCYQGVYYAGRWDLLIDLQGEFGGAFGAYLLLALVLPGAMVAFVFFGWTQSPEATLLGAAALFIALLAVSLYALVWYLWVKKRERLAFDTMQRRGEEQLAREEEKKRLASGVTAPALTHD